MLKILGRATSTNVQKVLWFCDEESIAYEHDNEIGGAYGRNDTPEYLAMNPNGRVPVVIDGDFVMWESNSIIRYLARKTNSALYPLDIRDQQLVERWMDWELSLAAPRHVPVFIGLVRTRPEDRNQAAIEAGVRGWNEAMAVLDGQLAKNEYVAGDALSLADIPLLPIAHRWLTLDIERPEAPGIRRWYDALAAREPVRKWVRIELA